MVFSIEKLNFDNMESGNTIALDRYILPDVGYMDADLDIHYEIKDHLGNLRLSYTVDWCNTCGIVPCNDETRQALVSIDYIAEYFAYGGILREYIGSSGQRERFLSTGHERDQNTTWDYRMARYYDADIGRFLGVDPLAVEAPGWSPYRYAFDNPVLFVDLNGLFEDHWEIDKEGNANLIDKKGNEIYVNGQNIIDFNFTDNVLAFSQINKYYGNLAGIDSKAIFPTLTYEKTLLISDDFPSDWKDIQRRPAALQAKSLNMPGAKQGIIGTLWNGKVYDRTTYENKYNLINCMVHERKHLLQNKAKYSSFEELEAVVFMMKHPTWNKTNENHRIEVIGYARQNCTELKKFYE